MKKPTHYTDLDGNSWDIASLDAEERRLLNRMMKLAASKPSWDEFDNFSFAEVAKLYDLRGIARKQSLKSTLFNIAADLSGRIAIAAGLARMSDYRDEIEEIIRTRFRTRKEFCQATGLTEDMLSHVLARRKNLGIETLRQALAKIGYQVRIVPCPTVKS